jgi:hypothetical protein
MRRIRERSDSVAWWFDFIAWKYAALILLPLAGGAGLVLHILVDASLPLAVVTIALLGVALWRLLIPRLQAGQRRQIRDRVRAGLVGGVVATCAYDATRYGIVTLLSFSFQPFHVLRLFGELFLGKEASAGPAYAVGIAYHVSNGVTFGITYALLFRRPGPVTGMIWGAALELCMAFLYPSWLRITALGEFLQVSAVGHLVYGAVLGLVVRQMLAATPAPDRRP